MRVGLLGLFWLMAPLAFGLDLLWKTPIESSARSLPVVTDSRGDGTKQIILTTRFDGSVRVFAASGSPANSFVRDRWLEGCIALAPRTRGEPPLFGYQDSAGTLYLSDLQSGLNLRADLEGGPRIGTGPCFGDLYQNGETGLVVGRRNGVVTAFDHLLTPLWQYQAGAGIDSSPAIAPAYAQESVVYVLSNDGVLHAIGGHGWPLWRYRMERPSPAFPSLSDPIVAYLGQLHASVLTSDREGWLYAVDALNGVEQWRCHAGSAALGTPALAELKAGEGRSIVTVSEAGEISILDGSGQISGTASLPKGRYIPRPLVADVDGDGKPEILVAALDWHFLVLSLEGAVKERIAIQGCAQEGLVLEDVKSDGKLELLVATDCGYLYCFGTRAKSGWTHPRVNGALTGTVAPIVPAQDFPAESSTRKDAAIRAVTISNPLPNRPFGYATVDIGKPPRVTTARLVVRVDGEIAGSTIQDLSSTRVETPFVQRSAGLVTLDLGLFDRKGKLLSSVSSVPVRPNTPKPIDLASPESLLAAVAGCASAYHVPNAWTPPTVQGHDSWSVMRYMPEQWEAYGLAKEPFVSEAATRVAAPASAPFKPGHPAWESVKNDGKPFFIMNDYFRPAAPYSAADLATIDLMAGDRFLGFQVHEWGYAAWKERLEGAPNPPETRSDATAILHRYFDEVADLCHGRIYAGEGYCLVYHQAYEWGAPLCYAEIGENIPCAPLQFAFLRGAAREYGGRPWGAYLSNWFRGTVADTRYSARTQKVRWSPPDLATGPDCGHSANLEYRLEMVSHLAGATFVHHESDAHNGSIFMQETAPKSYSISPFGAAMKEWYTYARQYPERGVAYTPIAFMVDFDHGWRPREDIYGLWPQSRSDQLLEKMFAHVFPWGGGLDFERGYLANGPYGDIFDVVTNHASAETLDNYGVLWPLGAMTLSKAQQDSWVDYVRQGGILILDSTLALQLPGNFLGLRLDDTLKYATDVQSGLGPLSPVSAPFPYRHFSPYHHMEVLAWTDSGAPLLAWRKEGKGILIVSGTDHWLDVDEHLVPLAEILLRAMSDAFLPLWLSGDVEMTINRTPDAWIVGLINNNGVTKTPTRAAVVSADGARDCLLKFKDKIVLSFKPRRGEWTWNPQANALNAHLPPGGVAVAEVRVANNN